jgi:hypothetical protein
MSDGGQAVDRQVRRRRRAAGDRRLGPGRIRQRARSRGRHGDRRSARALPAHRADRPGRNRRRARDVHLNRRANRTTGVVRADVRARPDAGDPGRRNAGANGPAACVHARHGRAQRVVPRWPSRLHDRIGIDDDGPRTARGSVRNATPRVNECGSGHVSRETRSVT